MSDIMKVWREFHEKGTITRAEADRRMKEIVAKDEKKVKHIPGRYTEYPYWEIDDETGEVAQVQGTSDTANVDWMYLSRLTGECSKTKEEAEFRHRQQKAYLTLIDKIHELNDGWVPDWMGSNNKFNFYYSYREGKVEIDDFTNIQTTKDELCFSSLEIGEQIRNELGSALIKLALWGIG